MVLTIQVTSYDFSYLSTSEQDLLCSLPKPITATITQVVKRPNLANSTYTIM